MIGLLLQKSADITVSFDALITAVATVMVALIGAGWFSRRNVKRTREAVQDAVGAHGADEMEGLEAIRKELELLHTAQASTNQLMVQMLNAHEARLKILEDRVSIHYP